MQPLARRRTPLGHAYADASAPNPFAEAGRDRRHDIAHGEILLYDLTVYGRFGIKGRGAGNWLKGRGLELPSVNTMVAAAGDLDLMRLGAEDFVLLSRPDAPSTALADLRAQWEGAAGPKGFDSWRDEVWAWFHLSGDRLSDFMARTCPVDLHRDRFAPSQVAQTRVAQMDCVVLRTHRTGRHGFDLLFDVASAEFALRSFEELGASGAG